MGVPAVQLKPFTQDCDAILSAREAAARNGVPTPAAGPASAAPCGYNVKSGVDATGAYSTAIYSGGVTKETLARMINGTGGRVLVDRTNLPGRESLEEPRLARVRQPQSSPPRSNAWFLLDMRSA
jgi:hypothetical protein